MAPGYLAGSLLLMANLLQFPLLAALASVALTACDASDTPTSFAEPPLRGHVAFDVNPTSAGLVVGDTLRLHAKPVVGFWVWRDTTVVWRTSRAQIAGVDSVTGLVTAHSPGSATITATLRTDVRYTAAARLDIVR